MVHRCISINGYSRKILWLFVGSTNNDPKVIAYYFVNCAVVNCAVSTSLNKSRQRFRYVAVAGIRKYFREDGEDDMAGINSFKFGLSTRNQRIEAWWSKLRRARFNWWINFFKDLCETGNFNLSKPFHLEVMRFCFIGLIQTELDEVKDMWNNHKI